MCFTTTDWSIQQQRATANTWKKYHRRLHANRQKSSLLYRTYSGAEKNARLTGIQVPHFDDTKAVIEQEISSAGMEYTIIRIGDRYLKSRHFIKCAGGPTDLLSEE